MMNLGSIWNDHLNIWMVKSISQLVLFPPFKTVSWPSWKRWSLNIKALKLENFQLISLKRSEKHPSGQCWRRHSFEPLQQPFEIQIERPTIIHHYYFCQNSTGRCCAGIVYIGASFGDHLDRFISPLTPFIRNHRSEARRIWCQEQRWHNSVCLFGWSLPSVQNCLRMPLGMATNHHAFRKKTCGSKTLEKCPVSTRSLSETTHSHTRRVESFLCIID